MGPLREALMQGIDINKLRKEEMRPVMLQVSEGSLSQLLHINLEILYMEASNILLLLSDKFSKIYAFIFSIVTGF